MDTCRWLETETPETANYLDPSTAPEYGVMNNPAYGHHVVYLGKRPTVSNPFFDLDGLGRGADFFLADGEEAAVEAMESARCRYALLTMRCYDMWYYHSLLGEERREDWLAQPLTNERKQRLLAEGPCLALYFADAAGPESLMLADGPLEAANRFDRFRLVYESHETVPPDWPGVPFAGRAVAAAKVFELVEGARVEGRVGREASVELRVRVATRTGRTFAWVRTAATGPDGAYSFLVPYAAAEDQATVTISVANRVLRAHSVAIPEEAVLEGAPVRVP